MQFIVAAAWHHPPYSWLNNYISDLGNTVCGQFAVPHGTAAYVCSPMYSTMNASFIVAGLLTIAGAILLRRFWPPAPAHHRGPGSLDCRGTRQVTLTMHDRTLLDRITKYSGDEPGTGALMTWVDSGWLMSIVVPYQPHFPAMPEDTYTLWGYGLLIDADGDYVSKKMSQATGEEILTELIGQLGFDDIGDEVLKTIDVTTVMMPYASALFSRRIPEDRPKVLPIAPRISPSSASSPICPRTSSLPSSAPSMVLCTPFSSSSASTWKYRRSTTASSTRRSG